MSYINTYNGQRLVEISIDEYRRSMFVSRCKIINHVPFRASVFILEDEYQYALKKERMENSTMYASPSYQFQQDNVTGCTTIGTIVLKTEPIKKKEEKVSKQIRHQFLKKRLLERVK